MMAIPSIVLFGVGIILLVLAVVVLIILWRIVKKLFAKLVILALNSLAGLIILLTMNLIFDVGISINLFTILVAGIFGVAGIGTLILLKLGGMI